MHEKLHCPKNRNQRPQRDAARQVRPTMLSSSYRVAVRDAFFKNEVAFPSPLFSVPQLYRSSRPLKEVNEVRFDLNYIGDPKPFSRTDVALPKTGPFDSLALEPLTRTKRAPHTVFDKETF